MHQEIPKCHFQAYSGVNIHKRWFAICNTKQKSSPAEIQFIRRHIDPAVRRWGFARLDHPHRKCAFHQQVKPFGGTAAKAEEPAI